MSLHPIAKLARSKQTKPGSANRSRTLAPRQGSPAPFLSPPPQFNPTPSSLLSRIQFDSTPTDISKSTGVFVSPFADLFTSNPSPEKVKATPAQPKLSAIPHRLQPTKHKAMPPTRPRSDSESASDAGPGPAAKPQKKKKRKQVRKDADAAAAAAALATALANTSHELEEGELEEAPLFFVDDTPAAVPEGEGFVIDSVGEAGGPAKAQPRAGGGDDEGDSEDAMRIFAGEVQATSDEESEEDEEDETGEQVVFTLDGAERHLASTEADLRRAIEGKIVDDSAAQVTGRYYKEADLTKSCALCGGKHAHAETGCWLDRADPLPSSPQSKGTPRGTAHTLSEY